MSRQQHNRRGTMDLTARSLVVGAAVLALLGPLQVVLYAEESGPAAAKSSSAATPAATSVDPATRKDLLAAEARLAAAIEKRDMTVLDELLADYYADSRKGAKRAYDKKGTLARCREGRLPAYPLEPEAQLTRSGDVITVEGQAKPTGVELRTEEASGELVPVRHLWTKKDGRWLLVAQVIGSQ